MIDFFKRKKLSPTSDNTTNSSGSMFDRFKEKLTKTRKVFYEGLTDIFLGKKEIDSEVLEELESLLITADVGVELTNEIIQKLTTKLSRNELKDITTLNHSLKEILLETLETSKASSISENSNQDISINEDVKPFVILMVGINGTGKTTTTGKLAKIFKEQGKSVILAAGDTFRAAAIEQLKVWGERNDIPVIAQTTGSDSASVIYDSVMSAKARNIDIVLADTAGRLHTQANLMEELKKIVRVIKKIDAKAPHEVILVLDAGIGQNAINQAKKFHEAINVTSLILTKLDGTARGGIIFNIAKTLKLPISFIGIGEGINDLRPFNALEFVEALLNDKDFNL